LEEETAECPVPYLVVAAQELIERAVGLEKVHEWIWAKEVHEVISLDPNPY
jgi:hypothetical protein